MRRPILIALSTAAIALGAASPAWAQASGSEITAAENACTAAAAAHFETNAEAVDLDVRRQRTRARSITLLVSVKAGDASAVMATCRVNRRTGEVSEFTVNG